MTPSKAAGTYSGEQRITLAVTDNADKAPKLYYTTNGSTPTATTANLYKAGTVIVAKANLRIRTLAVDASNNKVIRQLIDLALLQNNMLRGEALNNFVKRSIELI